MDNNTCRSKHEQEEVINKKVAKKGEGQYIYSELTGWVLKSQDEIDVIFDPAFPQIVQGMDELAKENTKLTRLKDALEV